MTVVAITVFVVAYVFIASDRVNKTVVALSGAAVRRSPGCCRVRRCVLLARNRDRLGRHLSAVRDDGDRIGAAPDRRLRVHRDMGGQARQGISGADHDPAGARDRSRIGAAGQRHHGPARRAGDPADVRPAQRSRRAVSDGRGVRVQHRRRVDVGRRSTEHHHREPGGSVVQRLSRPYAADRRDRDGGLRADAADGCSAARSTSTRTGWPT